MGVWDVATIYGELSVMKSASQCRSINCSNPEMAYTRAHPHIHFFNINVINFQVQYIKFFYLQYIKLIQA